MDSREGLTKVMQETLACLIIDDPLLKPSYGNLNYEELLQEMKEHNFFTEIAFIPWNYKRSDRKTINLFSDNPDYYSICVHGCDHLANEFGITNYEELDILAYTALWRMEQHSRLTGLPYDPVMVFPQGRFSSISAKVLKDTGYLAAFNSTLQAVDMDNIDEAEYQRPYTNKYYGFPIFLRRYPYDKMKFADDINNGRPIIVVEHPNAFRNGYKEITNTIDWINRLGNVKWKSLSYIADFYGCKPNISVNIKSNDLNISRGIKAGIRRFLCELRDTYIDNSDLLSNIYRKIRG